MPLSTQISQFICLLAIGKSIISINSSHTHQEFNESASYIVIDCCFSAIVTNFPGGALYISKNTSSLDISLSAFHSCQAKEGGGFFFDGHSFNCNGIIGENCSVCELPSSSVFFCSKAASACCINQSSACGCPNELTIYGSSSIFIDTTICQVISLNFTNNYFRNYYSGALHLNSSSNSKILYSLMAFCYISAHGTLLRANVNISLFIYNTSIVGNIFRKEGYLIIWESIQSHLGCYCCIFEDNSSFNAIYNRGSGSIALIGCFIDPKCINDSSITISNAFCEVTGAISLNISFFDRCLFPIYSFSSASSTPSEISSKNGVSGGQIAGIAIGVSAAVCVAGASIIYYLRFVAINNDDFHKARAYELTESIEKEYG